MKKFALLLGIASLLSATAWSQPVELTDCWAAWEFNTAGNSFTDGNWTFGEVFVPRQDLRIDLLGYYGRAGSFTSPHPVGLFDGVGDLLASTVIDNSSGFSYPHFAFNMIDVLTLQAGQIYVIEGVSGTDPYTWNDYGFQPFPGIMILGNNSVLDNGLNFNGIFFSNDVADGYWGANFGVTPEPGSLILLGTGLAAAFRLWRRK